MPIRYLSSGPLVLDAQDNCLHVDGVPAKLGAKAFGVLAALMARPRELISKDELFDVVWQGLIVSESALTTAVKELRQAIGDNARQPRFIETVHGRGYRFLHDVAQSESLPVFVTAAAQPPEPARPRQRIGTLAIILLVVLTGLIALFAVSIRRDTPPTAQTGRSDVHPKSIAVLPFADISSAQDYEWFAVGLTDEIVSGLAQTPDLRVISRTSVDRFVASGKAMADAASVLGVANVLEGSVRHEAGTVRVNARLVRVADGQQIWSQSYQRPAREVIGLQADVAFAIARALRTVTEPARLRAMLDAGTRSVDAYNAFLRSHFLAAESRRTGKVAFARAASREMERARLLDPGFSRAHWEAAQDWYGLETRIHAFAEEAPLSDVERRARFQARVAAAIRTAPDPERIKYGAAAALMQLRLRDAQRMLFEYVRRRPRDLETWAELIDYSAYAGDRESIARAAERVYTLSMESGEPQSRAITATVMAGDFKTAASRARAMLAASPDNAVIKYQAHRALLTVGATDEARALLSQLNTAEMPHDNMLVAHIRQACADGRTGDADAYYRRLLALPGVRNGPRWSAAMALGLRRTSFLVLEPYDTPERLTGLIQFMIYPDFDPSLYPSLSERLAREGVDPPPPVRMPFNCKRS